MSAVNNIGPADQFFHWTWIKAEFLLRHMRQKLGAGLVLRIEKLLALVAQAIVLRIFRREKSALMMVKPPGDLGRSGILEVDDGVLVAIEIRFIEERACAMHQPCELEFNIRPDAFAIEAGKQRRRGCSVKAFAVKKDPDFQKTFLCSFNLGVR